MLRLPRLSSSKGGLAGISTPDDGEEEAAERVAVARLDLHDLRAPVGEHAAGRGPGHPDAELHHPDPDHGACHGAHRAAARSASISAGSFGAAAERTSCPPSVTRTSSSMRMPMPRKAAGMSAASTGT